MDVFKQQYWSLELSLTWIWFRKKTRVQEVSETPKKEGRARNFFIYGLLPSNDPISAENTELFSTGHMEKAHMEKGANELLFYLQAGEVIGYGYVEFQGDLRPIPASNWVGATIDIFKNTPIAIWRERRRPGSTEWGDLHFEREQIVKQWPGNEKGELSDLSLTHTGDQGRPPKSAQIYEAEPIESEHRTTVSKEAAEKAVEKIAPKKLPLTSEEKKDALYSAAMPIMDAFKRKHGRFPKKAETAEALSKLPDFSWQDTYIERQLSQSELKTRYNLWCRQKKLLNNLCFRQK